MPPLAGTCEYSPQRLHAAQLARLLALGLDLGIAGFHAGGGRRAGVAFQQGGAMRARHVPVLCLHRCVVLLGQCIGLVFLGLRLRGVLRLALRLAISAATQRRDAQGRTQQIFHRRLQGKFNGNDTSLPRWN